MTHNKPTHPRSKTKIERPAQDPLNWILEQTPAILWTTDLNMVFTSSVGAGLKKMNLQPGQVVGMPVFDFLQTRILNMWL